MFAGIVQRLLHDAIDGCLEWRGNGVDVRAKPAIHRSARIPEIIDQVVDRGP